MDFIIVVLWFVRLTEFFCHLATVALLAMLYWKNRPRKKRHKR